MKSMDEVVKKFSTKKELQQEILEIRLLVGSQELTISKLSEELKLKLQEIEHLKKLLASAVPPLSKIEVQNEEMIAEFQLDRLKGVAQTRELSLEEARKFEIFSKIKQNSQKNQTLVPQFTQLPSSMDNKDLLQIAQNSILIDKTQDE